MKTGEKLRELDEEVLYNKNCVQNMAEMLMSFDDQIYSREPVQFCLLLSPLWVASTESTVALVPASLLFLRPLLAYLKPVCPTSCCSPPSWMAPQQPT
jgi:hypothetical protein